ncbi:hypothetical protein F4X88_11940 [Candidatus Poribacteria bacterium]|nr:hypothetical protein [Candidatus Poribacteria bacterium]
MKFRYFLILLLIITFGCSESEQPLNEDSETLNEDSEIAIEETPTLAPTNPPVQIQALSGSNFLESRVLLGMMINGDFLLPDGSYLSPGWDPVDPGKKRRIRDGKLINNTSMITSAGTPTSVYRLREGELMIEDVIFNKEYFYLQWFVMNNEIVLVNLLEEKIPFVDAWELADLPEDDPREKRLDEIWDEYRKKVDKIVEENNLVIDPAVGWRDQEGNIAKKELFDELEDPFITWEKEVSTHPFATYVYIEANSDVLEVNIKHTYTYKDVAGNERKMLFVKILRNLTRPHITFPRPFFP